MKLPPLLWALGLAIASPGLAAADPYSDAFERSAVEERAGRFDSALAILRDAEAKYPEDYALSLQIGWVSFRAGLWEDAEVAYARAAQLSHGAYDARLGLAWTRAKRGQCDRAAFAALSAERPEDTRASDGVRFCEQPSQSPYTAWGSGTYLLLRNAQAYGGAVGLLVTPGRWLFAGAYRGTWFPATGGRFRNSTDSTAQHEGYGTVGYGNRHAGLSVHYGYLSESATAHHVGATGRFSPFGDLLLAYSASLYSDSTIHRLELSWRLPLSKSISLRPAAGAQSVDGTLRYAGYLTLLGDHGGFGWWLGGKGGSETRPVYFGQAIVWNYSETISAGATAGVRATFGGTSVSLAYDLALLRNSVGFGRGLSSNHLFTLGFAFSPRGGNQ